VAINCGCVSTGSDPDAPRGEAAGLAETWVNALCRSDVDAAMALVAEDFTSSQWKSRQELADYLNLSRARGYFDSGDVIPAPSSADSASGTSGLEIASMRATLGTAVWYLTVREAGTESQIASARVEIY
jgi:hypothetical protein